MNRPQLHELPYKHTNRFASHDTQDTKRILIVTNAISEEEIEHIHAAFQQQNASHTSSKHNRMKITLVHVIPHLPTSYFNLPSMSMLVEKYYDEAKTILHEIARKLDVPKKDQWLIAGKIRTEVLRLADKLGANFILASALQIQELQRSLFFKNIRQYATIRHINCLQKI